MSCSFLSCIVFFVVVLNTRKLCITWLLFRLLKGRIKTIIIRLNIYLHLTQIYNFIETTVDAFPLLIIMLIMLFSFKNLLKKQSSRTRDREHQKTTKEDLNDVFLCGSHKFYEIV